MSDFGPVAYSEKWTEQVERMTKAFAHCLNKEQLETFSICYILDTAYSRSAICEAMKETEKAKGWR